MAAGPGSELRLPICLGVTLVSSAFSSDLSGVYKESINLSKPLLDPRHNFFARGAGMLPPEPGGRVVRSIILYGLRDVGRNVLLATIRNAAAAPIHGGGNRVRGSERPGSGHLVRSYGYVPRIPREKSDGSTSGCAPIQRVGRELHGLERFAVIGKAVHHCPFDKQAIDDVLQRVSGEHDEVSDLARLE